MRRWRAWAGVAGFSSAALLVCALTTLTRGWWRVLSPLAYQEERGMQVESVLATPLVWLARLHPDTWTVRYAESNSFEVFGPESTLQKFAAIASVLTVCTLAYGVCVAVRLALSNHEARPALVRRLWLGLAVLLVVSSKVFSPQYLLWLLPLVAVMVALDRGRRTLWIAICMALITMLTTLVYPVGYNALVFGDSPDLPVLLALTARNILVLVLAGLALAPSPERKAPADDPQAEADAEKTRDAAETVATPDEAPAAN